MRNFYLKLSESLNSHAAAQWAIMAFLYILTFLFPNSNPSLDALDYAAGIKFNFDLLEEHHLLHNIPAYVLYSFLSPNVEALQLMCFLSGIYFFLLLIVFRNLLLVLDFPQKTIGPLILIVGASWGLLRFSCSNETYILPLVFTLYGYTVLTRASRNNFPISKLSLAGFFLSIACLFHQIQVLWYLSIGISCIIYRRRELSWLKFVAFALPAFLVPLAYWLANLFYFDRGGSFTALLHSMFFVYSNPDTQASIDFRYFPVFLISIFRSFYQVSGYMFFLPQLSLTWIGAFAILGAYFLYYAFRIPYFCRTTVIKFRRFNLLIPIVLLLFSFVNGGNAEFLVGLPIALILSVEIVKIRQLALWDLGWPMLGWNLLFGLVVHSIYRLNPEPQIVAWLAARDNAVIVSEKSGELRAQWYYNYGIASPAPILDAPKSVAAEGSLLAKLDSLRSSNFSIYTDFPNALPFSRASMVNFSEAGLFLSKAPRDTVQAFELLSGNYYLYKLK